MGPVDPFFNWLAAQPAFVEVGLGIAFCLLIAPAVLAVIATSLTRFEEKVERIISQSGLLTADAGPAFAGKWQPLRRALIQELPRLRRANPKRHA
jgi:hypothetical protein